ncbi:integrase core domain protein [Oesophagostomum dentatum]|uniref:RNA-directed DNA polymerase n=1 Tax=Oesophagostomum dentatum TaxID=61180 RepID=A0A0B1SYI4_OESDE|nr:integrase core domain protein [Oesophagostomum dentatum]
MQKYDESKNDYYAIAYCSRTLSETERRWPAIQIELGAIIYALRQFKPYICLMDVILHSDHKPLTFLLSKSKTHDNLARWMVELQSYNIKVVHISGNKNTVADALSRAAEDRNETTTPAVELKDIIEFPVSLSCSTFEECMPIVSMPHNVAIQGCPEPIDFLNEQRNDPLLQSIFTIKANQLLPDALDENTRLQAETLANACVVRADGCLYYCKPTEGNPIHLLMVPHSLRDIVFHAYHCSPLSGGHMGWKKTLAKIMRKYYWPSIRRDVYTLCESCITCQMRRKPRPSFRERLIPVFSEAVFAKVGLDLCGPLPVTERGNKYILNIVCWFTRFVISVPLKDARANTIAHALLTECVLKYGTMSELVTDQASSFTSHFYTEFCNLLGIQQRFATPYHSMGNGATERTFHTFQVMLSKFINIKHEDWDLFLPCVSFCYNTSINEATGETPYFLMFGRDPVFTIDRILNPTERPHMPTFDEAAEYKAQLISALHLAWSQAAEHARDYKAKMSLQYDKHARPSNFQVGDRVFFRNYTTKIGLARKLCFPWIGQFRIIKLDPPHAIITSITSPQSKPRKVHLNQIKKVVEACGPASTLPTIPEEEAEFAQQPVEPIMGYQHDSSNSNAELPVQLSPSHNDSLGNSPQYNLRSRSTIRPPRRFDTD